MTFPTPFHPLFVLMFHPHSNPVPTPFQRCSIPSPIPPTPARARERGARACVRGLVLGAEPGGRPVDFMDRTDGHPAGLGMVPDPMIAGSLTFLVVSPAAFSVRGLRRIGWRRASRMGERPYAG